MKTLEKKPKQAKNIARTMLYTLAAAFVCGFLMMFLKGFMLGNGMEKTWAVINTLLFQDITAAGAETSIGLFYLIQTLFINGLQLAIVPLVVCSISLSMCTLSDTTKLGRIAMKTVLGFLFFYVFGCAFAILASVFSIRAGWFNTTFELMADTSGVAAYTIANPLNILIKAVPNNLLTPMSVNSSIIAVVFIAIVIGLCLNLLGGELKVIKTLLEDCNKIIGMYLDFVVNTCGPVCIFCMVVRTFSVYGWEQITPLLHYMGVAFVVLVFYWFIMYPLLVSLICKVNPLKFFKKTFKVGMWAFSVNSSAATLPLNRRTCLTELGCSETITDFVLPTGMTTAIEHVIAVAFIATVAQQQVTPIAYLTIMLLAIASAAGTPAIPNSGTVMIYATMTGAGFSSELCIMIYVLLLSLNKPIDMTVTALNVVGDAATNCLVCASEGELNREMFNS